MENRVKALEKVLYGNGREGLCDRVVRIETKLSEMEEHSKSIAHNAERMTAKMIEFETTQKHRSKTTNIVLIAIGLMISGIGLIDKLL